MDSEIIQPGTVEVELGEFGLIPGPKGDTGEQGPRGYGIDSAVMAPDHTLTLNFENGESYTTPSLRGADGVGVEDVELVREENGFTLRITLTDGKIKELPLENVTVTAPPQTGVSREYVDEAIRSAVFDAMAAGY